MGERAGLALTGVLTGVRPGLLKAVVSRSREVGVLLLAETGAGALLSDEDSGFFFSSRSCLLVGSSVFY